MFKISTGMQDALLLALASQLNGTMVLNIYSGTVPATADADLGGATLLRTVSVDSTGSGMSFEATTSGGMLVKSTSEIWAGQNVATGTASFYRIMNIGDTGATTTTAPRLQGSVGLLNADLILGNVGLVAGVTDPAIGIFMVGLPTE